MTTEELEAIEKHQEMLKWGLNPSYPAYILIYHYLKSLQARIYKLETVVGIEEEQ